MLDAIRGAGAGMPRPPSARPRASARRTSCWSTTRTPSSTRSPTTSARPAPTGLDPAHAGAARGVRPAEARPRRALARARHADGLRLRRHDQARSSARPADLRRLPRPAGHGRAFGGELASSTSRCTASRRASASKPGVVFSGLPKEVTVGRYHSIFADPVRLPDGFVVTAESEDGVIMAFEHAGATDRGGAVPPRVDHDARPRRRHARSRTSSRICRARRRKRRRGDTRAPAFPPLTGRPGW